MTIERGLFRALTCLYPRAHRKRFGAEMVAEFERRLSSVFGRGFVARAAFWRFILSDTAISLLREWSDEFRFHTTVRAAGRGQSGDGLMQNVIRDSLLAIRRFRREPGFTVISVLTVALGIGANTAIFSVVNSVLLRPLAFNDPDRIVLIGSTNPAEGQDFYFLSPRNFSDYREQNSSFSDLAAIWRSEFSYNDDDHDAVRMRTGLATGNLFEVLQVPPLLGRLFNESDGEPGAPEVVLLSEGVWRSRYGADPAVVGASITVETSTVATIIGVVPERFVFPRDAQAWRNLNFPLRIQSRGARWLSVVGRLNEDVSVEQARADMKTIAATLASEYPDGNRGWSVALQPLMESVVGNARTPLYILLGATGVILLIACANVANLLLSRSQGRLREMAVRAAIGADRRRLIGQLMIESLVLAAAGAIAGLGIATAATRTLVAVAPSSIPRLAETSIDPVVLAVLGVVTLITGLLFGIAPVAQLRHVELSGTLGDGSRGSAGVRHGRFRSALTVIQVTLTVVLVTSAGLLIKSFANIKAVDPGFTSNSVTSFEINLPERSYSLEDLPQFYRAVATRLATIPGVESVGFTSALPLRESLDYLATFGIRGQPAQSGEGSNRAYLREIDYGFLETMRVPLVAGRRFEETDTGETSGAAIINQRTAAMFFPDVDPLGQTITDVRDCYGPLGCILFDEYTIVGIVGDVNYGGLREEAGPSIYLPHSQAPFRRMTAVVRSNLTPAAVVSAARNGLNEMDPDLPLANAFTMEELVDRSLVRDRFATLLFTVFGGLALALASIGIYGVLSYSVRQRFSEIGIRMALGASPRELLKMVMGQGLALTATGLGLGYTISLAGGRILSSQLFGVSPSDPLTMLAVAPVLGGVALAASYLPALRATRVDPLAALRHQ